MPWEMNWASATSRPALRSTSRPMRQLKPPTPPPAALSRLPLRSAAVLMLRADRIDLRRTRRQAPDLLGLHAAADGDVVDIGDRGALRDGRGRGRRFTAVELDDVGVDAMLGEEAELLGDIGRGVHHVGRRDRDPDIDLAQRALAIGLRGGRRAAGIAHERGGGEQRQREDPAATHIRATSSNLP